MNTNATLVVCTLFWSACACAQTDGVVKGTVVNENGQPIAGVHVSVDLPRYALKRAPFRGVTDAQGNFSIDHVPWGTYSVNLEKIEDGYEDSWIGFYGNGVVRAVTVSAVAPTAVIDLTTGPKTGRITHISVIDASTGQQIKSASIRLSRGTVGAGGEIRYWYAISGPTTILPSFPHLVPSGVPIQILITAPGYVDWYYPGTPDKHAAKPVVFQPGEERTFDVVLRPAFPK